jgi:ribosomal protein S18 acetylase RimI-like enzyme
MSTATATTSTVPACKLRPMLPDDLKPVVALDAKVSGRSRRGYFGKRLDSALLHPETHIQIAAEADGKLAGFILYRVLTGEFGQTRRSAALESIAVDPARRQHGIGRALLDAAEKVMARKRIALNRTQADWRNHHLLRFLDSAGFQIAPRHILSLDLDAGMNGAGLHHVPPADAGEAPAEIDYGRPAQDDYERLSRDAVPIRSLQEADLPKLVAIERVSTGLDRADYLKAKMQEVLKESGVRVSLVAEADGAPVGFLMARVDYGEFGHADPLAVLDTMAVLPDYGRRGIAGALMSQLAVNLAALKIERIETEVARENFPLLGFLHRRGFAPAQRLVFAKPVA